MLGSDSLLGTNTASSAGPVEEADAFDDSWADSLPVLKGRKRESSWQPETTPPLVRGRSDTSCSSVTAPASSESQLLNGNELAEHEDDSWADMPAPGKWELSSSDHEDILRWVECVRVGRPAPGTRLVACKTPFEGPLALAAEEEGLMGEEERFDRADLLERCRAQGTPVGLVIDLVNTWKYYGGFTRADGVEYRKLPVRGRAVPPMWLLEQAFALIDDFEKRCPDRYVAVHCTHGVNRTGFFVAAYLMMRGHIRDHREAMGAFETVRGEKMDKKYLINALQYLEAYGWY